jgi:repressor LexA
MNTRLTSKQKIILATINDLKNKLGKSPTLEEIRKAIGYSGISSVQRHIDALRKKNILTSDKYHSRSLEVTLSSKETVNIPLLGNVACGSPLLAIENIEAYIPYEKPLLKGNPDEYFFLRAIGDSMNKTSIHGKTIDDGDFVLAKKKNAADLGDRVIALIGDEATIKKLEKGKGHYILQPESSNLDNKPIYLFENFSIQGIVVDVVKKPKN